MIWVTFKWGRKNVCFNRTPVFCNAAYNGLADSISTCEELNAMANGPIYFGYIGKNRNVWNGIKKTGNFLLLCPSDSFFSHANPLTVRVHFTSFYCLSKQAIHFLCQSAKHDRSHENNKQNMTIMHNTHKYQKW